MRIIVVGCGKIGYTIAKGLSTEKDINVTVVNSNPDVYDNLAEPIDAIFIVGNGANEKILSEAGAKDADLIVSTTNSDELNILCCIMAKHIGTKHSITRVRDPDYSLESNKLWKSLGIDVVINPEQQTAKEILRILKYPTAEGIEAFIDGRIELVSFKVSDAPEYFVDKNVSQIFNRQNKILLAIIERENSELIPHSNFVFEHSDVIRILGQPSEIINFLHS
ncbi:MAG: NAD-binding protein [Nitrososphaerota archaeon]|nr:NAD-binding protein [Nitrososphaerota archaeon]